MLRICLRDYIDYSKAMFLEFLKIQDSPDIIIEFSREYSSASPEEIPWVMEEYVEIAYEANKLFSFCEHVSYFVPDPRCKSPISIEIKCNKFRKLAKVLHSAVVCYNPDREDFLPHKEKGYKFFNRAFDNKLFAGVWGLLYIVDYLRQLENKELPPENEIKWRKP